MSDNDWPPEGTWVRFRPTWYWPDQLYGILGKVQDNVASVHMPTRGMRYGVERHEIEVIDE